MNAALAGLNGGALPLQDIAAQYGRDSEELLSQIQKDKALMESFGIDYKLEPYGVQKFPEMVEEDDDSDTKDDSEDGSSRELDRALITALEAVK